MGSPLLYQDPNYNPEDDKFSFVNKFDPVHVVNVDKDVEAVIDLGCSTFSHFHTSVFSHFCVSVFLIFTCICVHSE